jgi:phosphoserine phosphatase
LKFVVFDMDGVLVDVDSSWQTVHRILGVDNEDNFQQYLEGRIDYWEFVRRDVKLWGKTPATRIQELVNRLPLMKGAKETIQALKGEGVRTAIISSGISLLVERVRDELGVDRIFANKLHVDGEGYLTGECDRIVALLEKGRALRMLAELECVTVKECAAVGDSVYDIPLFKEAGLGIAFNAGDVRVRREADVVVKGGDLRAILPSLLGRVRGDSEPLGGFSP